VADERELIRSRVNIVDLVQQRVPLKKTGKTWKGLCPFHDDRNPSFTVSPDTGRYRCWSCGAAGDAFNWVMETQKLDFREAMKVLAEAAGVTLTAYEKGDVDRRKEQLDIMAAAQAIFREQLAKSEEAVAYCNDRKLTAEVRDAWGLGYAPHVGGLMTMELKKRGISLTEAKELFLVERDDSGGFYDKFRSRLMIPIYDERGHLVAYGGRIIGAGQPKYINSSDTPLFSKSHLLYGLNRAKETMAKTGRGVLVEGFMDVIACHRAGVTNAVASLGTSLTEDQVKILKRWCTEVVILYDRDGAGQKAAEKATEMLMLAGVKARIALPPQGEDPDSLLNKEGPHAVERIIETAVDPIDHRLTLIRERFKPTDDEYWVQAVAALALAENALELERRLVPLAAEYPGMSDKASAQNALRRMVGSARKGHRGGQTVETPRVMRQPKLSGLERVVLAALLGEELRAEAWPMLEPLRQFSRSDGARAAAAALLSLGKCPSGGVGTWIDRLGDEESKTLIASLYDALPAPSREDFEAAVRRIRQSLEDWERQRLVEGVGDDNDALRALQEKLQAAKGVKTVVVEKAKNVDPFS
jgi:DNA primase